ncbi:MAG: hypothetical protein V1660_02225 [archaeon]
MIKNKLYAKYSVACIFITPGEVGDLGGAIVGELEREFGRGSV